MKHLGYTRSAFRQDHLLQTPDTFVRTPLPGLSGGVAIVHCGPALGASFTQYTVELDSGGTLAAGASQQFIYVIEGTGTIQIPGQVTELRSGGFCYLPEGQEHLLTAESSLRAAVFEKPYVSLKSVKPPQFFTSRESVVAAHALGGDEALQVRSLMPADEAFDFAVNTMTYDPGTSLSMVEIHVMEHGLLMLQGEGIYRLGDYWYPVQAGDFIWMRAFCPQWFGALGKKPAKYLIYKDWNRLA